MNKIIGKRYTFIKSKNLFLNIVLNIIKERIIDSIPHAKAIKKTTITKYSNIIHIQVHITPIVKLI